MSGIGPGEPQRALIVLPSTGEYDSRAWRIARVLHDRGHIVTVLARWSPGLAREEIHPAGYAIVRSPVSAIDGLPLPRWARASIAHLRARALASRRRRLNPPLASAAPGMRSASSEATARAGGSRSQSWIGGVVRIAALTLTVRSQARAAREVAPMVDLVHGMAYMGVPVALSIGRRSGARVVYDARDIYIDAGNLARLPRPARAVVARFERRWARAADRVITVNQAYAEVMAERWRLGLPAVVLNCPFLFDPPDPARRRFHEILGLPAHARVVLYHGGFSPDRGIEQLVAAIRDIPDAILVLLGYGVLRAQLESMAAAPALDDPVLGRLVRIVDAVPPSELLEWIAAADVVVMPIQPTTLNHRLTTPNKLFEAMAAGVPVVASDLPGMAPIIAQTGCGSVVDPTDAVAIAAAARSILDAPAGERAAYRRRAIAAARGTYNWEHQVEVLLAEYGRLTGRPW